MQHQRRDFIKLTTAGAATLALTRPRNALAAWPSTGTMEINPDIPNMRVVACVDTAMMKSTPKSMTFQTQNDAVDWPRVQANMDNMAMKLANKGTPEEAWKTIFRSGKDWAQTVVAIKVNAGESKNTTRLAVLQKFSNIFTGWGVKPENFIIYDGHSPATSIYNSSFSTTDKNKIMGVVSAPSGQTGDLLGGWKDAKLGNGTTRRCAAKIADGSVDILIDIANNKGHMMFGKVTLCMKNHYGTWEPDPQHTDLNNLIYNMNKGDPIIGGTPPRQQLCMVDSMFCNKADIFGTPELMPCYLVMGTLAPAVDYCTVKKIREEVSGLTHDSATVNSYLTAWGYKTSDPEWILVPPAGATGGDAGAGGSGGGTGTGTGKGGASGKDASAGNGGASGTGGTNDVVGRDAGRDVAGSKGGSTASTTSGNGGAKGSGGLAAGSGGTKNPGGAESGGAQGKGGSGGSGSGGVAGSGGSAKSGGHEVTGTSNGCEIGGGGVGLGVALGVGAIVAGGLRRLLARREGVAADETKPEDKPEEKSEPST
jgi:hypothetical protein